MVSVYNFSKTKQYIVMRQESSQEIEFKWRARSKSDFERFRRHAKILGALSSRPRLRRLSDCYVDTPGGRFAAQGLKCRLRRAGNEWELTLKSFARLQKGLAQRLEKEFPLPRFKSKTAALRRVARRLAPLLAPGTGLVQLFEIRNSRTACRYRLPGKTEAEASFDRVVISRGKKKVRMMEIEFEFLNGDLISFKKFIRAVTREAALKPQKKSKVATAVSAFSLERRMPGSAASQNNFVRIAARLSSILRRT